MGTLMVEFVNCREPIGNRRSLAAASIYGSERAILDAADFEMAWRISAINMSVLKGLSA